jgi:hypothetical protein
MLIPATRRYSRGPIVRRPLGMGACQSGEEPECFPAAGACVSATGESMPCPDVTSVDVCDKSPGSLCLQFAFPWVGKIAACRCKPAFDVPSPWGTVATVGIIALLGLKLVKGMR